MGFNVLLEVLVFNKSIAILIEKQAGSYHAFIKILMFADAVVDTEYN